MLEKTLETKACQRIKGLGGLALKFNSPSSRGWPDRLILCHNGNIFWIEFKKKGRKPTKLQDYRHNALIQRGFHVYSCHSDAQLTEILSLEGVLCD